MFKPGVHYTPIMDIAAENYEKGGKGLVLAVEVVLVNWGIISTTIFIMKYHPPHGSPNLSPKTTISFKKKKGG